jgi:alkylhydroperoxidase family enzyme
VIRAREREERAWALKCAIATAAAGLPDGQQYLEDLWEHLRASVPDDEVDPDREAAEIEQAQAQARLDGMVRQVKVSRDDGAPPDPLPGLP